MGNNNSNINDWVPVKKEPINDWVPITPKGEDVKPTGQTVDGIPTVTKVEPKIPTSWSDLNYGAKEKKPVDWSKQSSMTIDYSTPTQSNYSKKYIDLEYNEALGLSIPKVKDGVKFESAISIAESMKDGQHDPYNNYNPVQVDKAFETVVKDLPNTQVYTDKDVEKIKDSQLIKANDYFDKQFKDIDYKIELQKSVGNLKAVAELTLERKNIENAKNDFLSEIDKEYSSIANIRSYVGQRPDFYTNPEYTNPQSNTFDQQLFNRGLSITYPQNETTQEDLKRAWDSKRLWYEKSKLNLYGANDDKMLHSLSHDQIVKNAIDSELPLNNRYISEFDSQIEQLNSFLGGEEGINKQIKEAQELFQKDPRLKTLGNNESIYKELLDKRDEINNKILEFQNKKQKHLDRNKALNDYSSIYLKDVNNFLDKSKQAAIDYANRDFVSNTFVDLADWGFGKAAGVNDLLEEISLYGASPKEQKMKMIEIQSSDLAFKQLMGNYRPDVEERTQFSKKDPLTGEITLNFSTIPFNLVKFALESYGIGLPGRVTSETLVAVSGLTKLAESRTKSFLLGATERLGAFPGMGLGTALLFGDQTFKNEYAKTGDYDFSFRVASMRLGFETASELTNLLDIKLTKAPELTIKQLTSDEAYKTALNTKALFFKNLFRTKFGNKYDNAVDYLFNLKGFPKSMGWEGFKEYFEEFEANVANWAYDKQLLKEREDYPQQNELSFENEVVTALNTIVGMGLMGGVNFHRDNKNSIQTAKYLVGSNSEVFLRDLKDKLDNGEITQPYFKKMSSELSRLKTVNDMSEVDYTPISTAINEFSEDLVDFTQEEVTNAKNKVTNLTDNSRLIIFSNNEEIQRLRSESNILQQQLQGATEEKAEEIAGKIEKLAEQSVKLIENNNAIKLNTIQNVANYYNSVKDSPHLFRDEIKVANPKEVYSGTNKPTHIDVAEKPIKETGETISFTTAEGKPFQLKFNTPYYLSSLEDISTEGSKITKRPLVTLISDNGDGSLTISSDGEVQTIRKSDLKKYQFTEKERVDKLREEGDIKALFFDHENDVFRYVFSEETKDRQKEPVGRIKREDNNYFFVYKDKKGNIRKQLIKEEDFTVQKDKKGKPYPHPKLVFERTLATKEENDIREAQYQERLRQTNLKKLDAQKDRRGSVLNDFVKSEYEKLTKLQSGKINKLSKSLTKIRESIAYLKSIAKITNLKNISEKDLKQNLPKDVYNLIKSFNQPLSKYDILVALNEQIKFLKNQANEIEGEIAPLEAERTAILDELGAEYEEILTREFDSDVSLTQQIKEHRDSIKEQLQANTSLLEKLRSLIDDIKDTLSKTGDWLINIIPKFETTVYNPLSEEEKEGVNEDLRLKLENSETKLKETEEEIKKLEVAYKRADKVFKFIQSKEKEYQDQKNKEFVTQRKEQIFKKHIDSQTSTLTNSPQQDKEKAKDSEKSANKFDISEIFTTTTWRTDTDENGNVTNPVALRWNNFLNRVKTLKGLQLLVITKDNAAKHGLSEILFTNDKITNKTDKQEDNDIKLVIFRDGKKGEMVFLDEFGEEIQTPNKDNIIYTSLRLPSLNWEIGEVNHTIKGKTEGETKEIAELFRLAHVEFRQEIVDVTKQGHDVIFDVGGITRGLENDKLRTNTPQPVLGNVIPENTDLVRQEVIFFPSERNNNTVQYKGQNRLVNMPSGRPILSLGQHFSFLHNRKFTSEEAKKITSLFVYLYEQYTSKTPNETEAQVVLDYLKRILYFRNPDKKSQVTQTKQTTPIGKSQVWFSTDNNKLNLHLGANNVVIPFEFSPSDQKNILTLQAFLNGELEGESAFHNIDAYHSPDNTKSALLEPFTEITGVKNGVLQKRQWESYQQYLLSNKYPDNTQRPVSEIPLTVNLKPSTPTAPNIIGRQVTINSPLNDSVISKTGYTIVTDKKNTAVTPSAKQDNKEEPKWSEPIQDKDFTKLTPTEESMKEFKYSFRVEDDEVVVVFRVGKGKKSYIIKHNFEGATHEVVKEFIDNFLEGKQKPQLLSILQERKISKEEFAIKKQKAPDFTEQTAFKQEEKFKEVEKPKIAEESDTISEEEKRKIDELLKDDKKSGIDPADFRIAKSIPAKYENLEKARKWFAERFPNIRFETVVGLIEDKAWGRVKDAAVTLSNLAEEGTIFHEAFGVVHAYFLSERQLKNLRAQFRNRKGTFIDRETDKEVKYSEATNHQIREELSEEYRTYELSDGKIKWEGEYEKNSLFRRIFNFIRDFVFGDPLTIEEVFKNISEARYKDQTPNFNKQQATDYRVEKIKQEDPSFFNDVMQGITSILFNTLQERDAPILSIFEKGNEFNFTNEYQNVKNKIDAYYGGESILNILSTIGSKSRFINYFKGNAEFQKLSNKLANLPIEEYLGTKISREELLDKLYDVLKGYETINNNWGEFVFEHSIYLKKFGLELELEQLETEAQEEDDKSHNEYAVSDFEYSRKSNARSEVKLLIATLKQMDFKEEVINEKLGIVKRVAKRNLNSLMMSNLVDYGQTITALLYKMTPSTTFDEMMNIIEEEANINPSLKPLLSKLGVDKPLTESIVDLRSKFFQSMNNLRVNADKLIINSSLNGAVANLNDTRAITLTKEMWMNSLKESNAIKQVDGNLVIDKSHFKTKSIVNEKDAQKFLQELGFEFPNVSRLSSKDKEQFLSSVRDLFNVVYGNNADLIFHNHVLTQTPLNKLADIYIKYTNTYAEPQYFNIQGKPVQNILQNNFIGYISKVFSNFTIQEFWNRIPQLNPNNDGNGFLSFSLLNNADRRRDSLPIHIIDGSQIDDSDGTQTSKLNIIDRIAQEFSLNLKGIYYFITPADVKQEWAVEFGEFITKSQATDNEYILSILKDYLKAEILSIQDFLNGKTSNIEQLNKLNEDKTKKIGEELRLFKPILKGVDLVITTTKTPEEVIAEQEEAIDTAILDYLSKNADKTFQFFDENGIIIDYKPSEEEGKEDSSGFKETSSFKENPAFKSEEIVSQQKRTNDTNLAIAFAPNSVNQDGLTLSEVKDIIKHANLNYLVNIIEQHKLFWGDPAQWKDINKRVKSYVSGANTSVTGQYFDEWYNQKANTRTFIDLKGNIKTVILKPGDIGYWSYNGSIRTHTAKDDEVVSEYFNDINNAIREQKSKDIYGKSYSELTEEERRTADNQNEADKYERITEPDGQSVALPLGYREIRQRDNSWTEAEEEQYNWDEALFRLDNDFYEKDEEGHITENGQELKSHDLRLAEKGNPYLLRAKNSLTLPIFNVLKPIYSGFKETNTAIQNLDKMSIAPITWRMVKEFPALRQWYITHYKAGTTYVKFQSANKVGATTDTPKFYNSDGSVNTDIKHDLLNFKYFGIQVETKTQKTTSTLGTQTTKQVTLDLISNGVPVDFKGSKAEFNSLSESQKKAQSNAYRLSQENDNVLKYMKINAKNRLFDDFGIQEVEKQGKKFYQLTNLFSLADLIISELQNRQASENLINSVRLNENNTFDIPFDLIVGGEKIESLIMALVEKRIMRPKMFGGQLPQIAVTLFNKGKRNLAYKKEGLWTKVENLDNLSEEEKKTVRVTSSNLKFYENEDGKRYCEVYLPFYMREFISKGQELSIDDIPENLRYGIGFRIPTQGLNSIEHFKIKGFLPVEYGDSIVLPSEIVTKAGSDFDIDKLNVYLYNYRVKNNKPVKIEYDTKTDKKSIENRYNRRYRKVQRFLNWFSTREAQHTFKEKKRFIDFVEQTNFLEFLNTLPEGSGVHEFLEEVSTEEGLKYVDLTKTYEENLSNLTTLAELESKTHISFEEFEKLPLELQNTKEALENRYIDVLRQILQLPENFASLVEPNSTKVLKDAEQYINRLYKGAEEPKSLLDRLDNAFTRHSFLMGKDAVGIGASHMSLHGLSQKVDLGFEVDLEAGQKFHFDTNSKQEGNLVRYSLSSVLSKDGKRISHIISSFLSAFVDISKDPFIININGGYTTASYYITAIKLGIPVRDVVLWFNQPVIRDFIHEYEKNRSILTKANDKKLYFSQILDNLGEKYGFAYGEPIVKDSNFTEEELEGFIKHYVSNQKTGKYSSKFSESQGLLLKDFIYLTQVSWELFHYQQAINWDVARTTTFDAVRIKWAKVNKAKDGLFKDYITPLLSNSFISIPFNAKKEVINSLGALYLTEHPIVREILNPILSDLYKAGLPKDQIEKEARNLKKDFITYLLHTTPISINNQEPKLLTSYIKDFFLSDENIAKKLRAYQLQEKEGKLSPNFFLRSLQSIFPKILKSKVSNIRLLKKVNDKFDSDLLTSDFANLRNEGLESFTYDLIIQSLLQSGVKVTPKSLHEIIPNELFTKITTQIKEIFSKEDLRPTQVQISNFINSYYENNWQNRQVVEKAQSKTTKGKSRLSNIFIIKRAIKEVNLTKNITFLRYFVENDQFKATPKQAHRRYVMYSELKRDEEGRPIYNKEQRRQMAKNGDFSFLDRALFKRLEIINPDTNLPDTPVVTDEYGNKFVLFYPVNKKGDGDNLTEHYAIPSESAIWKSFPIWTDDQIYKALQISNSLTSKFLYQHYFPERTLSKDWLSEESEIESNLPTSFNSPDILLPLSETEDQVQEQEVIEQPIQNKEGIDFVFEQSSELAKIGSKEQYSSYISTIFPESKVKEILHHGTIFDFPSFSKKKLGKYTQAASATKGFFFTNNKLVSDTYITKERIEEQNWIHEQNKKVIERHGKLQDTKQLDSKIEELKGLLQFDNNNTLFLPENSPKYFNDSEFIVFKSEKDSKFGGYKEESGWGALEPQKYYKHYYNSTTHKYEWKEIPKQNLEGFRKRLFLEPEKKDTKYDKNFVQKQLDWLEYLRDLFEQGEDLPNLPIKFYWDEKKGESYGNRELLNTYIINKYAEIGKTSYRMPVAVTKNVVLNLKNPLTFDYEGKKYRDVTYYDKLKEAENNKNDGAILKNTYDSGLKKEDEYLADVFVAFEPEQIHILGNKQDIEGFKNFVEQPINKEIKPKIDSSKKINIYAGTNENAELSNFSVRPFKLGGENYQTVEAAFQAAKIAYAPATEENLKIGDKLATNISGAIAKKLGSQIKGLEVSKWDKDSSTIMKETLLESFKQNLKALEILLATGNAELTHTQDKGKWGKEFPKLLMEVRSELTQEQPIVEETKEEDKGEFDNFDPLIPC